MMRWLRGISKWVHKEKVIGNEDSIAMLLKENSDLQKQLSDFKKKNSKFVKEMKLNCSKSRNSWKEIYHKQLVGEKSMEIQRQKIIVMEKEIKDVAQSNCDGKVKRTLNELVSTVEETDAKIRECVEKLVSCQTSTLTNKNELILVNKKLCQVLQTNEEKIINLCGKKVQNEKVVEIFTNEQKSKLENILENAEAKIEGLFTNNVELLEVVQQTIPYKTEICFKADLRQPRYSFQTNVSSKCQFQDNSFEITILYQQSYDKRKRLHNIHVYTKRT